MKEEKRKRWSPSPKVGLTKKEVELIYFQKNKKGLTSVILVPIRLQK